MDQTTYIDAYRLWSVHSIATVERADNNVILLINLDAQPLSDYLQKGVIGKVNVENELFWDASNGLPYSSWKMKPSKLSYR